MTYIIAEAGTAHYDEDPSKRLSNAIQCAWRACLAQANAVKFQMFVPDEPLFCPLEGDEKRWERWNNTMMTKDEWAWLKTKCQQYEVDFMASVFQPTALEWLKDLRPKYYKVASRAAKTFPYDNCSGPFIVSRGLGECASIPSDALQLQCTMKYPTPLSEAGWNSYDGLSDHSGTVWPGLDAIYRGAKFLEVHFCPPDRDPGNDKAVALSCMDLTVLCRARDAMRQMCG